MKRKFTKAQEELALKISNDISEDIDCGETKKQLRMAVAYWADAHCEAAQKLANARSSLRLYDIGCRLLTAEISTANGEPQKTTKTVWSLKEIADSWRKRQGVTAKAKGGGE